METYNITQKRGETWHGLTLQFLISSVPVNLSGANILMQLKKNSCDTDAVVEFSNVNGGITLLSPLSAGRFSINSYVFDELPKAYYYDLRVEANDRIDYLIGGTFEITYNVSRP